MRIVNGVVLSAISLGVVLAKFFDSSLIFIPLGLLFLVVNILPSPLNFKIKSFRLRMCADGSDLLVSFLIATVISIVVHIFLIFTMWQFDFFWILFYVSSVITAVVTLAIAFWNGIIRVYCTSVQLGVKQRVIGALCGWIPIVNIVALYFIIKTVTKEVDFEIEKNRVNDLRKDDRVCDTKYPILLVHGVFFRDFKFPNYWGRIPDELVANGATIFYGNHQSALSIADSGVELAKRIEEIVSQKGCEKVNIIAHSKGGLDCRYALSKCGVDKYVASLTTINTPHRGCMFADFLLKKISGDIQQKVAGGYNATLKKLGDTNPDFITAVNDLTYSSCKEFNENVPDVSGIYYQSVGSRLNRAGNGKFPLNFSYHLVKCFDGANDGLVSEESFPWGESYRLLTVKGKRGISHGDMVDLNRENIPEFDVREFYVNLVADLKNRGF